jgi:hypothetical protein
MVRLRVNGRCGGDLSAHARDDQARLNVLGPQLDRLAADLRGRGRGRPLCLAGAGCADVRLEGAVRAEEPLDVALGAGRTVDLQWHVPPGALISAHECELREVNVVVVVVTGKELLVDINDRRIGGRDALCRVRAAIEEQVLAIRLYEVGRVVAIRARLRAPRPQQRYLRHASPDPR